MKRLGKTLLASVLIVLMMAGCTMKEEIGFQVTSDKRVHVVMTVAYDKEMIDGLISMKQTTVQKLLLILLLR